MKVKLERRGDFYSPERERERRQREANPANPGNPAAPVPAPEPDRPKRPEMEKEEGKSEQGNADEEKGNAAEPKPAFLGVVFSATDNGFEISRVFDDSAAKKAGLKVGDVVTKMDGKGYGALAELAAALRARSAGDKVTFTLSREGKQQTVDVTLGQRPE